MIDPFLIGISVMTGVAVIIAFIVNHLYNHTQRAKKESGSDVLDRLDRRARREHSR